MSVDQTAFSFGSASSAESGCESGVGDGARNHEVIPHLRDEVARVWGLPLGESVEVTFIPAFAMPSIRGLLELRDDPAYPWDAHQPLILRISGCDFTTRDIERWSLLS